MRFAELGLCVAIVNDFCAPPRGTIRRPLPGLPSLQYQLLLVRDRQQSPAALALEAAIIASIHPSKKPEHWIFSFGAPGRMN